MSDTKTQHTPGPWILHRKSARIEVAIPSMPRSSYAFSLDDEANARLISAAPELLKALNELLARLPVGFVSSSWGITPKTGEKNKIAVDKARAAIAKATGASL
jgi:hypothetical protein